MGMSCVRWYRQFLALPTGWLPWRFSFEGFWVLAGILLDFLVGSFDRGDGMGMIPITVSPLKRCGFDRFISLDLCCGNLMRDLVWKHLHNLPIERSGRNEIVFGTPLWTRCRDCLMSDLAPSHARPPTL